MMMDSIHVCGVGTVDDYVFSRVALKGETGVAMDQDRLVGGLGQERQHGFVGT